MAKRRADAGFRPTPAVGRRPTSPDIDSNEYERYRLSVYLTDREVLDIAGGTLPATVQQQLVEQVNGSIEACRLAGLDFRAEIGKPAK